MALVTETTPGTLPSINQKSDVQVVPSGAEDQWVDAGDMNALGQHVVSVARAVRFNALVAFVAGDTEAINGKAFRFTKKDSTSGLPEATATLTSDLNKVWAAAMEALEQGGDEDGTASNTAGFGVGAGLLSGASGAFATGTLYGLSAGGGLTAYAGGKLPPVAIGLSPTSAMFDAGGRVMADGNTLEFNASGVLQAKSGASQTFGNVDVNGTLKVSGAATFSGTLTAVGAATFEAAITAKTTYATRAISPAQITGDQNDYDPGDASFWRLNTDASRNITGIVAGADGERLTIVNVGSFDLVLQHQNAGSAAANRMLCDTGADITLAAEQGADLIYDSTTARWRTFQK